MKQKLLMMLAALMLMGTSAMAQSETLKGDVNGDGAVDVADIAASAAIMIRNTEEVGGAKFYWYIGRENPMDMTSISSTVTDKSSMGWRLIGVVVPVYSMAAPLWDGQVNEIVFDEYNDVTAYLALPNNMIKPHDGLGNDLTSNFAFLGTKTIGNVEYYIYSNKSSGSLMSCSLDFPLY